MRVTHIQRTIRSTKRLTTIIKVLTKFGFKEIITDLGLDSFSSGKKNTDIPDGNQVDASISRPVRMRLILEELGPTYIKLGQILATRPDLIPPEWAQEFKLLQDNCSQVPFSEIEEVLVQEFPGRLHQLFSAIEETPLAAASMAQVHRATLVNGTAVVLKVLRPGNRKIVEEDMALLEWLAQFVEDYFSNLGYSPVAVATEFSREMIKEMNFLQEAQATDKLRRYFEDDPNISFPKVYREASTRNVLTLEEIKGRPLSSVDPKSLRPEERRKIVANGTDAVFKQCLRYGFFHADPHPGNIFLLPGQHLCFIDCGMTGQLDKKTAEQLIDLVAAIIQGNIDKLCRVVVELSDVDPAVTDKRDFRSDAQIMVAAFENADLKQLDITKLLSDFFAMLQRYHISCPSDLLMLTKALTTIEGVAEHFDPSFNVLAHVEPQIKEVVTKRYGFTALRDRMQKSMNNYGELIENLPLDVQRILDQVRHNRLTLNLEMKRIEHLADKIDLSSRVMGISMIISALIVGSSILILADSLAKKQGILGVLGIVGLVGAGLYSAGFVASSLLPKKKKK
ncbi:putative unusual protein kinase [Desulfocapsa sulfexigens DSM 10523]|uniref:Putative unusual protein kinase n=1 Tax=Desulfocapsa sulfexigens (strain DSM 10523 / SB164P1) TaxID=1167006 RepID=M1P941_DESSD|nr:putative unusual protein kinase [Desulfocapsa sulfexigens DSM 10523]